jgi:hypothetical protein
VRVAVFRFEMLPEPRRPLCLVAAIKERAVSGRSVKFSFMSFQLLSAAKGGIAARVRARVLCGFTLLISLTGSHGGRWWQLRELGMLR